MDKELLLQDFLNKFPESNHPLDMRRFVKYALACAESQSGIDRDTMIAANMSEARVSQLEHAYDWIREAYDCLYEEDRLVQS